MTETTNTALTGAAISSFAYILLVLICIGLSWYGLQQLRFDVFLRNPKSAAAKILQVFLSIALGYSVARFAIDYFTWSTGWSALMHALF